MSVACESADHSGNRDASKVDGEVDNGRECRMERPARERRILNKSQLPRTIPPSVHDRHRSHSIHHYKAHLVQLCRIVRSLNSKRFNFYDERACFSRSREPFYIRRHTNLESNRTEMFVYGDSTTGIEAHEGMRVSRRCAFCLPIDWMGYVRTF